MTTYELFLQSKRHSAHDHGIEPMWLPAALFDYQQHVTEQTIRKGRYGNFLDTGLGKTLIELTTAHNYVLHTNRPTLIITPLAVAFQFIQQADTFGIPDVEYSKDGRFTKKIVVCNYERLHHFDPNDFHCVILDESSILKNFDGITRQRLTVFLKKIKYRYLFTATPSPNDYIELGTSSEALGYLGYADMLTRFFKTNNGAMDSNKGSGDYYLKPHAAPDFWRWVASWSITMRRPSDLGYSDERHQLPPLYELDTIVNNPNPLAIGGQYSLLSLPAKNWRETRAEVKATVRERCEAAAQKAAAHDVSVYWVNRNDEAALLRILDPHAVEIHGSMDIEEKEDILIAFGKGDIKKLITKTTITCFGLNWQHCAHTTFFPSDSWEQYYQAIRRFYRFGQQRPVIVDRILSDGQTRTLERLTTKKDKAERAYQFLTQQTNSDFTIAERDFTKNIQLPKFIAA